MGYTRGKNPILMSVDNQLLKLDPFLIQTSLSGRQFWVAGIEKDLSLDSECIDEETFNLKSVQRLIKLVKQF